MTVTMSSDPRIDFVLILVLVPLVLSAVVALTAAFDRLVGGAASPSALGTGGSESRATPMPASDASPDRVTGVVRREPATKSLPNQVCSIAPTRPGATTGATLVTQ
jgi:hypothetical protein